MTHAEYVKLVAQLPALGEHLAGLKLGYQAARSDARFAKVETDVGDWKLRQKSQKRRYTKSELAEIRDQTESEHADERRHTAADLKTALSVAQEQLETVHRHSERLRPEWQTVPVSAGDYATAMLRMGDDIATGSIRERLTGRDWVHVAAAYTDAVESGDRIAQRVIEEERDQLRLSQPTSADVVALYRLVSTIRETRATRHPEEATTLQPLVNDLTKDLRTDELAVTFTPILSAVA